MCCPVTLWLLQALTPTLSKQTCYKAHNVTHVAHTHTPLRALCRYLIESVGAKFANRSDCLAWAKRSIPRRVTTKRGIALLRQAAPVGASFDVALANDVVRACVRACVRAGVVHRLSCFAAI